MRVALEATAELSATTTSGAGPPISHTFLLAAAVPEPMCDPTGKFTAPLPGAREHAFFSPDDTTLALWFEPGQRLFSKLELGEAVGLHGKPGRKRWHQPWNTWLDHNEYWTDSVVSDEVLRRLGHPVPRPLTRRPMTPARIASRGLAGAALMPRKLASRKI